jgi:GT2 family glycosyltransferase
MATADSPRTQALAGSGGGPDLRSEIPTVAAVVVTRNPGDRLEHTLRSLRAQDYQSVAVMVVDAGSHDDPTARIAAALPDAYVHRMPNSGFAVAANEALYAVRNATFLLICHDDVVLDPSAVRVMLEEAFRSNAGIVGPKLVDVDNPDLLLEVGRSIDRFGIPHTGIEPGELDHEQHDGVRDVFYVPDAAMLVRTDLFHELGGFDPAAFPGAEDLDFCWRARLAGARVMVAPDARVRHHEAARHRGDGAPDPVAMARTRIRTVLTLSSVRTLLWVVPVGIAASFVEALVLTITFRRRRMRSALGAWWWNLRRLREVRRARRRARRVRRVDDSDLRDLQVRGARWRGFVTDHVATEDRVRSLADTGRSAVSAATAGARQPLFALVAVLALVWLIGSRALFDSGVPAVGTMARWPGIGDLLSTYASGWRYTGLGSSTAAPPGLVVMAGLSTVLFGADGLARTLLVVAAFPIGAFGAYRLTRDATASTVPAVVAGVAYAINPVPRNAIANGRLGPLVVFALMPFLVALAMRLAQRGPGRAGRDRRGVLALGLLLAFTTAWYPLAPLVLAAAVIAIMLAAPFVAGISLGLRMLAAAVVATVIAGVLLFPWSTSLVGAGDATSLGFAFRPRLDLVDVLRFHSGPNGAGWAGWGLLVAAALALVFGRGPRFMWATRGWMLAVVGWALVWLPARFATDTSVPAPEVGLTLAALGIAVAAGLSASTFAEDIRRRGFGVRQAVAAFAAAAFLLAALGFAVDAGDGRWRAPDGDWPNTLAFLEAERDAGGFRVLWLGDPAALPLDPFVARDGTGYVLTRNGPGDATELWRAPAREADDLVGDAVRLASERRTERLGHLLAPMSVRYVAVPNRSGPGASDTVPTPGLARTLDDQLDLARLESPSGLVLYQNTAWIPNPGTVRPADARNVPLRSKDPTEAALRADRGRVSAVRGPASDSEPTGPGLVLWSEAFDSGWSASASGRDLRHVEPFGWANGFSATRRSSVSIRYGGQLRRYGLILVQFALWIVLAIVWRGRVWRGRGRRRPRRRRIPRPNL